MQLTWHTEKRYAEVILYRFEKFTGKEAIKLK